MQPTLTRLTLERYQHCLPLCRIYLHTAGKKEEKAEFEKVRTSRHSSRQLLRLGVRLLRFCEFFGGKKNKTRKICIKKDSVYKVKYEQKKQSLFFNG